MKIEFNLTKEDYIAFNIHHIDNSPTIKRSLLIQRYGVSLIFLIVPFIFSRMSGVPWMLSLAVYGVIFLAWITYYPKYFMYVTKKRVIRLIEEGDNSDILGTYSVTLTEEGVEQTSNSEESKSSWNAIQRIEETPDYFYIYISAINAYLVPIRAFGGITEKAVFMQILREKGKL
ncbi:MAG: YcxB family protein [Lutisporaceae bacterium]